MDIHQRNNLRAEAHLPLLDVAAEAERLARLRDEAAFEREWAKRRHEFEHRWQGNRDGWITNMGRESMARQQVRREMKKPQD